ncbi:hypothetical protein HG442_001655 [Candidatus Gracilibacteria bacterium]|nr:hypothetical protein [Candidatus Gracilibacteria bacterium]
MNAKAIFEKTFGGLSREYYFREFIFGLIFVVLFFYPYYAKGMTIPPIGVILTAILSQILYPYSRFVYHSVMDFIFGNNMFVVNAFLMLILKFLMMMICWFFAIFIAPIGLLYLYYHHTKEEKKLQAEEENAQNPDEEK